MVESSAGLQQLEEQVREQLAELDYPSKEWVIERTYDGQPVTDVLVVGGGQGGLAVAFGLKQAKINNIMVLDQSAPGREGPWGTVARMETLRTPKHLTGPDNGVPALTPRAWYEAKHGKQAWIDLGKWPVQDWHDYLQWFRQAASIPVTNDARVTAIKPTGGADDPLAVTIESGGGMKTVYARKIVLATGIEGSGKWNVPETISSALPRERYSHTSEEIDFEKLKGKRVAVLGAGASAFDNAGVALEKGAASVELFVRRDKIPAKNPYRWMEKQGFLEAFNRMADPLKWQYADYILSINQPPPQDTYNRCAKHKNFDIHLGAPWTSVREVDGEIEITTPQGTQRFDHIIVGAGFVMDYGARPELAAFADNIATWGDRYAPPADQRNEVLATYPYLGPGFEFQEKQPGRTPWSRNIMNFTFAAFPSMGLSGASISGMKAGVKHIVDGIVSSLFVEDAAAHFRNLVDFPGIELADTALASHPAPNAPR